MGGEVASVLMFAVVCGVLHAGLPGRLQPRRHGAGLRRHRLGPRHLRPAPAGRPAVALPRHHGQRGAGRRAAVRLHGGDAGAREDRRSAPRDHGPAVRPAARRTGPERGFRRHAAGGVDRHRRRHGGDHGRAQPADHAARRLRSEAGDGDDQRVGNPGPDHPAVDRAGPPGRRPAGRLRRGAARYRQLGAGAGLGDRPVRRRLRPGDDPGGLLHGLDPGPGGPRPGELPGPDRRRRARGRARAQGGDGALAAGPSDPRRPRLDPGRRRDADRGRRGRLRRRAPARRARRAWREDRGHRSATARTPDPRPCARLVRSTLCRSLALAGAGAP